MPTEPLTGQQKKQSDWNTRARMAVTAALDALNTVRNLRVEGGALGLPAALEPESFVGENDHLDAAKITAAWAVVDELSTLLGADGRYGKLYALKR